MGNAYQEAYMQEKLYMVMGPEFGTGEGHMLRINKPIYGFKSSGLHWWKNCCMILLNMGIKPSKAEEDIWMMQLGEVFEYLARYVDDLAIDSKIPWEYWRS